MLETPRAARVLWIGSLIFAGTAILASREPESAPPVAVGSRPAVVLWAWERPELLDFIDPREVEVAVLAGTLRLESSSVQDLPRLQPLELPRAARRTAVVRIESVQGAALTPAQRRLATAAVVAWSRSYDGVQIDFDATVSERPFYRRLLEDLRRELPAAVPISMIAADPAATGSTSEGPGPEVESLLAAAAELVPSGAQVTDSPAYLTAAYHRSRLRWNVGRGTPVGEIDRLRDNGWCEAALQADAVPGQIVRTPEQIAAVQADLPELPAWPNFVGPVVLARAETHPDEPRLAEALHRVVRATASAAPWSATAKSRAPPSSFYIGVSRRARGRRRRRTGSIDRIIRRSSTTPSPTPSPPG